MVAPSRAEALETLEAGQAELDALFGQLSEEELSRPASIGGGDWAAKDLMGHIAFWEELALDTIDASRAGRRPRVDDLSGPADTDRVNAENQERTVLQSTSEIRARAASAHQALLAAFHSLSDAEWNAHTRSEQPTPRSLGELLGGVLGAPNRPFGHAYAHVDDLRAYAQSIQR